MKKTDIAMIILIASVSILISNFAITSLMGNTSEKKDTTNVKTTAPISDKFIEPSTDIFNKQAINPTVQIVIGEGDGKIVDTKQTEN